MDETSTLEVLGTVLSYTTPKGKLIINPNNWARKDKRVMMKLVNDKGENIQALLNMNLSNALRSEEITGNDILHCNFGKNDRDQYFIFPVMEEVELDLSTVKIKKAKPSTVKFEDLVTF